jgi:hypothetical protein
MNFSIAVSIWFNIFLSIIKHYYDKFMKYFYSDIKLVNGSLVLSSYKKDIKIPHITLPNNYLNIYVVSAKEEDRYLSGYIDPAECPIYNSEHRLIKIGKKVIPYYPRPDEYNYIIIEFQMEIYIKKTKGYIDYYSIISELSI